MTRGQRIETVSAGSMMQGGGMQGMTGGGTLTATAINLGQQGLRGTVSADDAVTEHTHHHGSEMTMKP